MLESGLRASDKLKSKERDVPAARPVCARLRSRAADDNDEKVKNFVSTFLLLCTTEIIFHICFKVSSCIWSLTSKINVFVFFSVRCSALPMGVLWTWLSSCCLTQLLLLLLISSFWVQDASKHGAAKCDVYLIDLFFIFRFICQQCGGGGPICHRHLHKHWTRNAPLEQIYNENIRRANARRPPSSPLIWHMDGAHKAH